MLIDVPEVVRILWHQRHATPLFGKRIIRVTFLHGKASFMTAKSYKAADKPTLMLQDATQHDHLTDLDPLESPSFLSVI